MISKNLLFIISLFIFSNSIIAQEITINIGLDTTNVERNEIIKLWTNYIKSKPDELYNNPYWSENDKSKYKSYDLLKSEGFLNPSLYYFKLDNKILSISKLKNDYLIKSAFYDKESFDIYAITNVVATKIKGKFYLTNYQSIITSDWKIKTIGNITYHYFPEYNFIEEKAIKANSYLAKICKIFDLKATKINYFICRDCENIFQIKGFDYVLSMGNAIECGFFDSYNTIIYATQLAGENHQHELTHYINNFFPNANELLLIGLSAYWGEENAHKGKPLIYSIKRVNEFLKLNSEIDLNKPNEFWKMDEETNPQYVTGAIICDLAIKKGGIPLLKEFLESGKSDKDFLLFIEKKLNIKKGKLNDYLRDKINEISLKNEFSSAI